MEKLFNREGIHNWETYRFQCDCTEPSDCLDLHIDYNDNTVCFCFFPRNWRSVRQRIKDTISFIRGKIPYHETVLRRSDIPEMIRVLQEADKVIPNNEKQRVY